MPSRQASFTSNLSISSAVGASMGFARAMSALNIDPTLRSISMIGPFSVEFSAGLSRI
jgi:hypothetical protein